MKNSDYNITYYVNNYNDVGYLNTPFLKTYAFNYPFNNHNLNCTVNTNIALDDIFVLLQKNKNLKKQLNFTMKDQLFRMDIQDSYLYMFFTKGPINLCLIEKLFPINLTIKELTLFYKEFLNHTIYGIKYHKNYIEKNPFYKFNKDIYKNLKLKKMDFKKTFDEVIKDYSLKICVKICNKKNICVNKQEDEKCQKLLIKNMNINPIFVPFFNVFCTILYDIYGAENITDKEELYPEKQLNSCFTTPKQKELIKKTYSTEMKLHYLMLLAYKICGNHKTLHPFITITEIYHIDNFIHTIGRNYLNKEKGNKIKAIFAAAFDLCPEKDILYTSLINNINIYKSQNLILDNLNLIKVNLKGKASKKNAQKYIETNVTYLENLLEKIFKNIYEN